MDIAYMKRAVALAEQGLGYTNPNPLVGAVIVKNQSIIGEGFHECYGQLHAERNALASCTEDPAGADLYVTLEPCCHYGQTPPCTEAIIKAGIATVFIGSRDPNPLVAGKGVEALQQAGITVVQDVLKEECDGLNPFFFHYIKSGMPYAALKYAMTLDGKIATKTGKSQWITGEPAREHVQQLRHRYAGIMTGIGTVLADDPRLTCRMPGGRNPVRIICDTQLRIPVTSTLCQTAEEVPTIVATSRQLCLPQASDGKQGQAGKGAAIKQRSENEQELLQEKVLNLKSRGVELIQVPARSGRLDLTVLMEELGRRKLDSVLVEGGGELAANLLEEKLIQRIYAYVAPKIFGSSEAKGPVAGRGADTLDQAVLLELKQTRHFGEDLMLEYEVR